MLTQEGKLTRTLKYFLAVIYVKFTPALLSRAVMVEVRLQKLCKLIFLAHKYFYDSQV